MPAPDFDLRLVFAGGLATDYGTQADLGGSTSRAEIPFLLTADNAFFELRGSLRKVGGTTKYNSVAIESGEEIRGMFEYVRSGTAGTPTRKRVVYAGTKILADDNDGTFVAIKTGLEDNKVPNFTVFTDVLIMASDSTVDVPMKWDQTTLANLGGTPPNFAFSTEHVNRLWAAGDAALPSRLYYSAQLNPEDWSSADAGFIDIAPNDGDVITGLIAHRGVLFVFKGPNFGAIHIISGRTPSDFARDLFSGEVGGVGPNTVFTFGNDVGFLALDGSIRSISATDKYGNFEEAALSRPLTYWMLHHMNSDALNLAWARTDPTRGYVLFTLPVYSATKPNYVLCMDYKQSPVRFTTWSAFGAYSVARMSDRSGFDRPVLYLGGSDGFIRLPQQDARTIDGADYRFFAQAPYLHFNTPNRLKTLQHVGLGLQVRGSSTATVTIRPDGDAAPTVVEFDETSGYTYGVGSSRPLIFGTGTWAGASYRTSWVDVDAGQFREASFEIENMSGDIEVDVLHLVFEDSQNPSYE